MFLIQILTASEWFSPGSLVSFTNKTNLHDSRNCVESSVKHHNPILLMYITLQQTYEDTEWAIKNSKSMNTLCNGQYDKQ